MMNPPSTSKMSRRPLPAPHALFASRFARNATAMALGLALLGTAAWVQMPGPVATQAFIVQGSDLAAARAAVLAVGGQITHELGIIGAVGARLTKAQAEALHGRPQVRAVFADGELQVSGGAIPDTAFRAEIGADLLFDEGIDGTGVTVAVIDTGMWYSYNDLKNDLSGDNRIVAEYDAIANKVAHSKDEAGHGTHITTVIAGTKISDSGEPQGVAPNVKLVNVKAFGDDGSGSYADVIRALNWVVTNKNTYNIRVVNLSFSAPPRSHYWDDPINQAVMAAWKAGIVVVASAGNTGPDPMTIGVPGNVPYVITVGAMSDNWTPEQPQRRRAGLLLGRRPDRTMVSSSPRSWRRAATSSRSWTTATTRSPKITRNGSWTTTGSIRCPAPRSRRRWSPASWR